MTEYIQLSAPYILANVDRGVCPYCGECDKDKCFVKLCPSCCEYWKSAARKYLNDGRPAEQHCPECVVFNDVLDYLKANHENAKELYAFCYECECVEIFDGSTADFAEKLVEMGWVGCSCKAGEILCGECRDKQPMVRGYW